MTQLHPLLQADFIVPSSREAVDCDSAWNEVLREQVPSLFLQALQSFQQLAASSADMPMAWVNRWLQSIPLPREVLVSSFPCVHQQGWQRIVTKSVPSFMLSMCTSSLMTTFAKHCHSITAQLHSTASA